MTAADFNPNAPLSGDNYTAFRAYIAKQQGIGQSLFGNFDGTPAAYANLDPADQIALTNAMNAYIRANPAQANAIQRQIAGNPPIQAPEKLTVAEKATQLPGVGDAIDTAYKVNKELNPLAFFDSLAKVKWLIIGGVVIYFVGVPLARAYIAKKG